MRQPPCPMSSPANQRWTRYFCLKILPVPTHSECGFSLKLHPMHCNDWLVEHSSSGLQKAEHTFLKAALSQLMCTMNQGCKPRPGPWKNGWPGPKNFQDCSSPPHSENSPSLTVTYPATPPKNFLLPRPALPWSKKCCPVHPCNEPTAVVVPWWEEAGSRQIIVMLAWMKSVRI